MRPRYSLAQTRPQISTMPRQKTEAAAYLDIYKLVTEKTRLQQELETLNQRRDRLQNRLEILGEKIAALEIDAHQLRNAEPTVVTPKKQTKPVDSDSFNLLFLEY